MDSKQLSLRKFGEISSISNLLIFDSKPIQMEFHISSIKYLQVVSLFFINCIHALKPFPSKYVVGDGPVH